MERQLTMSLPQMLADLPRACDVGTKRNAKGHTTSWIGYKLHATRPMTGSGIMGIDA